MDAPFNASASGASLRRSPSWFAAPTAPAALSARRRRGAGRNATATVVLPAVGSMLQDMAPLTRQRRSPWRPRAKPGTTSGQLPTADSDSGHDGEFREEEAELECLEEKVIAGEGEGSEPGDYDRRAHIFDESARVFLALKRRETQHHHHHHPDQEQF